MKGKTTECPTEEMLCGFADGTLEERRKEVEAHLAECERCLSIYADLMSAARSLPGAALEAPPLELERRVQGKPLTHLEPDRGEGFLRRFAAAVFSYRAAGAVAAVSIAGLLAVWVGQQDRRPGEIPPAVREGPGHSGGPVLVGPEGCIVAEDSVRFHWDPCPRGEHYVVTILNADSGTVVIREAVPSGELLVPAERLIQSGGTRFEWMVECTLNDGHVLYSSVLPFDLARSLAEE